MSSHFQLFRSTKIGLTGYENYILARGDVGYIRIVGGDRSWDVMTATANEDSGAIRACPHQSRLCEAAKRLGIERNTNPSERQDRFGRQYIMLCSWSGTPDASMNDDAHVTNFCTRFFEIYDAKCSS